MFNSENWIGNLQCFLFENNFGNLYPFNVNILRSWFDFKTTTKNRLLAFRKTSSIQQGNAHYTVVFFKLNSNLFFFRCILFNRVQHKHRSFIIWKQINCRECYNQEISSSIISCIRRKWCNNYINLSEQLNVLAACELEQFLMGFVWKVYRYVQPPQYTEIDKLSLGDRLGLSRWKRLHCKLSLKISQVQSMPSKTTATEQLKSVFLRTLLHFFTCPTLRNYVVFYIAVRKFMNYDYYQTLHTHINDNTIESN